MGAWRHGWRRISEAGLEGWRTIIKKASWSRFRSLCEREEATINVISTCSFGSYAVFKFHTSAPEFSRLVNAVEKIASQAPSAPKQEETKENEKDAPAVLPSSPEPQTSEETKDNDAPALPSQSQPAEE